MRIIIDATDQTTHIEGVPVRVWEGVTDQGVVCKLFVHRMAIPDAGDRVKFNEQLPLTQDVTVESVL